ncbi:MAG: epoxyqueuosine reductase QueH [Roseburia sp.]|nr:epoxyqueuosine reductase QueH [Anaeroplasma bactoclasticum]MCM1196351.1 epoxyqueuosine reductase QueH [Roseburia sp.]MCM1556472.1 epoxyqueuosine reductase QueH [Anaeroplasma bactoclasticum]
MLENYREFKNFLNTLKCHPKLLLHSCCAPCSSHVLFLLKDYFEITVFYSNDNIYPVEEYQKRLEEEIRFCKEIDPNIKVIYDSYQALDYSNAIKGYESLGEKTERCYKCYELRLEKTAVKALELGFDYFTTTLSISPHKVSKWINEIGFKLEEKYKVAFLYSDYKKEEGYKHSIELSKEYGLYRQDYCGCFYSKEERRNVHAEE